MFLTYFSNIYSYYCTCCTYYAKKAEQNHSDFAPLSPVLLSAQF